MTNRPAGTVTFLFADIEGSTRLLEQLGDRYPQVLDDYRRLFRKALEERGGKEIDTSGDGFCVAFPRARDALSAAIAAQRAMAAHSWPDGTFLRVRVGIHTGEPMIGDTGYVGVDLHRAACICAAGHGGQVLISQTTHELVARDVPDSVMLRDLGEHRLKDMAHPDHLYQAVVPDLPAEFPPLKSLDALPNNLPVQLTSFVGRSRERTEIHRLLDTARLLTLTGVGGAGKTRLALQVAAEVLEGSPDGAWLVELAPLADPALLPNAIAAALKVRDQPDRPILDVLVDYLEQKRLLIVLDNCEHLVTASARVADELLRACPNLKILATSREALGVAGEAAYIVPSLSVPQSTTVALDALGEFEAVRLFVERAVAVLPTFRLDLQNAPAVAAICRHLDGIPLAIELAAARVNALSAEDIAARLYGRFTLLTGGSQTTIPRHRTLRAALDWSYGLLTDRERALLRRLAVFAGGFTLEAAEAVCAGGGVETSEVLETLVHLVEKSLVMFHAQERRYGLLETVRQYGVERLIESGEGAWVRGQHGAYFLHLAEQAEPLLRGSEQRGWLERLEGENNNLRAALEWSKSADDGAERLLRLAAALWRFWHVHGYWREGRQCLEGALAKAPAVPAPIRTKALFGAGVLAIWQQDYGPAFSFLEASLAAARTLGDDRAAAAALRALSQAAWWQGDYERARALGEESLTVFRQIGDQWGISSALRHHGFQILTRHERKRELSRAAALFEESLGISRTLQDARGVGWSICGLGITARLARGYKRAEGLLREALSLFRELGDKYGMVNTLIEVGRVAVRRGDTERAARLFGAAQSLREAVGAPLLPYDLPSYSRQYSAETQLRGTGFDSIWAEGRAMTLEQVMDYALAQARPPRASMAGWPADLLTPREQDVAALIAGGLTNREIAERLVITERTAETHVQHILNKLGINSRAQIAAWAATHGLHSPETD